jgi:hypothetical protein
MLCHCLLDLLSSDKNAPGQCRMTSHWQLHFPPVFQFCSCVSSVLDVLDVLARNSECACALNLAWGRGYVFDATVPFIPTHIYMVIHNCYIAFRTGHTCTLVSFNSLNHTFSHPHPTTKNCTPLKTKTNRKNI